MPQERPDQMTPEDALAIVRGACEIAGEAPSDQFSLDEKVRLASARNIVEAFFHIGLNAARQRAAAKQSGETGSPSARIVPLADESKPGEDPVETVRRRAREEAEKQKAERLAEETPEETPDTEAKDTA